MSAGVALCRTLGRLGGSSIDAAALDADLAEALTRLGIRSDVRAEALRPEELAAVYDSLKLSRPPD